MKNFFQFVRYGLSAYDYRYQENCRAYAGGDYRREFNGQVENVRAYAGDNPENAQ